MAEIAFNTVGNLLAQLVVLAAKEVRSALRVRRDLDKLKETLEIIAAVRSDVEGSQHLMKRELQQWLGRLTDICTSAEDVLDEFVIADLQWKVLHQKRNMRKRVRTFLSSENTIIFAHTMSKKIKGIIVDLDKVASDRHKFHISGSHVHSNVDPEWRETHSDIDVTNVIGRVSDIDDLVEKLRRSNSDAAVVSVVGIGGMGKTTVVKYVYNDARVSQHFELRKWVFVGQTFDVKKIIGEIVDDRKDSSMEHLQDLLKKSLRDKRYLLVLDDVWNEDQGKWFGLKELLRGGNGSKIVVTTRSQSVAKVMSSSHTHTLQSLPTQDSRSLFKRWALKEGQSQHTSSFNEIASEIANKSIGVPLAITTLTKFLNKHGERQWSLDKNKSFWSLAQDKSDISPVIELSYNHLTSFNLKQCFSFCAMFEKGTTLRSTEMVYIWMALGFLESGHDENQLDAEDIGERYFNELNSKLFFRDVHDLWFSHTFKLHDLMHDLALFVMKGQLATLSDDTSEGNRNLVAKKVRHVSLRNANLVSKGEIPTSVVELARLRTIIADYDVGPCCSKPFLETCFSKFTYLRVLYFTDTNIMVLPNSIGELKYLKYLSLCGNTTIEALPDSLCTLVSLQALCLKGCTSLKGLPEDFAELISLRYLYLTTKEMQLPYLNDGCLDELRYLEIERCSNLESLSNLNMKLKLRTLIVRDCVTLQSFPNNLRQLHRLENLVFSKCPRLTLKTMEQNMVTLLYLRVVSFEGLCMLECLPRWLAFQTALQRLEINDCPNMDSIMEGSNRLPHGLKELRIWCCPRLVERCQHWEWDRVAHIPIIQFHGVNPKQSIT